jgi:glycosyltransferase involved in cell wall biosynthesis
VNVLVISTLYPNAAQPVHALFVEQRVRAMAERFPVRVLCPIPSFPLVSRMARYAHRRGIPQHADWRGVSVGYPRFLSIPRILKPLDGVFLFAACLAAALRMRRDFPVDRIDAHLAFPDGWAAVWLGRVLRVPVTVTLRGHDINDLPRFPCRWSQVRWTLRNADGIMPVADALRVAALEAGAPAARVRTVENGVDASRFCFGEASAARRDLGWDSEARVILSVGHLVARKGFCQLVRALPKVLESVPRARLVIAGGPGEEGDITAELHRTIEECGVSDRVTLLGAVAHEDLPPYYQASDLFCLASEKEGRANVLVEAQACGTPVVATAVWGTPDVVGGTENGLLVESTDRSGLADAIRIALSREWDRRAIASRGGKCLWEDTARQVEEVLIRVGEKS